MTTATSHDDADALVDPAEAELEALGRATAALGDRHAVIPLRPDPSRAAPALDRRDLTDRTEIVERMARDILAARRDGQHGLLIDLTEFGWTQAQAMRWGTAAHEAARSPAIATQDAVERLAARDGAHTVTVASIDVARIVAAGEAAVAAALADHPAADAATDTAAIARSDAVDDEALRRRIETTDPDFGGDAA